MISLIPEWSPSLLYPSRLIAHDRLVGSPTIILDTVKRVRHVDESEVARLMGHEGLGVPGVDALLEPQDDGLQPTVRRGVGAGLPVSGLRHRLTRFVGSRFPFKTWRAEAVDPWKRNVYETSLMSIS